MTRLIDAGAAKLLWGEEDEWDSECIRDRLDRMPTIRCIECAHARWNEPQLYGWDHCQFVLHIRTDFGCSEFKRIER